MAIRVQAHEPRETYGDFILRALADGEINPKTYFWCKDAGGEGITYLAPTPRVRVERPLPPVPKGGVHVKSLGAGAL